jgi:hypothetical protein
MMEKYGLQLLRNGYNVIPITPGGKAPGIAHWQRVQTTEEHITLWGKNGFRHAGIGITTGHLVFIDLDIPNACVEEMVRWCKEKLGFAPARVGNAPKLGLLYRSEVPIPTRISSGYYDGDGQRCCVEILGNGRQFVAYAIHPDTGRPYRWDKGFNPLAMRAEDLTVVRFADVLLIFEKLAEIAAREGWTTRSASLPLKDGEETKKTVCGYSDPKVRQFLMLVPNDNKFDAREDWMKIGFAVHHETGGSEFGRELWLEWSEQHSSHDFMLFDKAWNSFGRHADDEAYREVTFRYVVKLAGLVKAERLHELMFDLDLATTMEQVERITTDGKKLGLNERDREVLADELKLTAARLGQQLRLPAIREMLRPEPIYEGNWLDGWVYLTHPNQFYNARTGQQIDRTAFDMAYTRFIDDVTPSRFAVKIAKIPILHMTMYLPGAENSFRDASGLDWVNTYRDTAPSMPAEYSERDRRNIEIVKAHFTHIFGETHDIEILLSTLAYIVQTGGRVNWITVIQGAEQIGKTFFADLMGVILGGSPHVHPMDTDTLTNSSFTEWAQGHQLVYIEELKVHGKRYDVMDKLKPYITNQHISIHPKGTKQYSAINTTSYFAFTNHRDAVPVTEGDTRYFIMLSQWQDDEAVRAFKAANPDYYRRLFATLKESPGALRHWLMNFKIDPGFDPVARAPFSEGKRTIIDEGKSDLQTEIEDLIAAGATPGVSHDLIIIHLLIAALGDEMPSGVSSKAVAGVLRRLQYVPIRGRRVKITRDGIHQDFYCWTKDSKIRSMSTDVIREIINKALYPCA